MHVGVASEAHEREELERLCGYVTRAAVSTARLSLTTQGNIRYRLNTPYRDGTTDVVFEPLDFTARLAALVPTPRANLTCYYRVFALSGRSFWFECPRLDRPSDRSWPPRGSCRTATN